MQADSRGIVIAARCPGVGAVRTVWIEPVSPSG